MKRAWWALPACSVAFGALGGRIHWVCACGSASKRTWSPTDDRSAETAAAAHVSRRRKQALARVAT